MSARWLDHPFDDAELTALAREGVDCVALPLHGARAEVHEWIAATSAETAPPSSPTGLESREGSETASDDCPAREFRGFRTDRRSSFSAALKALDGARSLGMQRIVWTRLTRSNARVLSELPSLLKAQRVALWVIEVPPSSLPGPGGLEETWTRVVPRFGLALPSALAAMERARALGVDARILGAPRCVLGRFAERALPSPARAYAPVCDGCPSHRGCPGLDDAYLERFGARELRQAAWIEPLPCALFERLDHCRPARALGR